jgi:hypothetical protein
MEKFIAGVVTGMAILAAIRGVHLFVTVHTSEMVSSFQADSVCVINGAISFKLIKVICLKTFGSMTALAAYFIGRAAVGMTPCTVFIFNRGSQGVMVTD